MSQLLSREDDPDRPSLENRVAFQWEHGPDTLGYRQATQRDAVVLGWLASAVQNSADPASVLDIGCAYGNHLLMLDAFLDNAPNIALNGIDAFPDAVAYGRSFAAHVPGYQNCSFDVADIEKGLPFEGRTFDAVNLADVLEHLEDPLGTLREIRRVMRPGGTLVISTPLRDSLFKRAARGLNWCTGGRLYSSYYKGKNTELDEAGEPLMETHAGHEHISEMKYGQLVDVVEASGFRIADTQLMPIMSGSAWFDRHPFLLSGCMFMEAVHGVLQRPSWAHAVCVRALA